jgi:hypothetical protein
MSFKLFILQTFGKIKPTEKIEASRLALWNDYQEFLKVESSDELKQYLELEELSGSGVFSQKKKEVEAIGFKGSKENGQLREYNKLAGSKRIKSYLETVKSGELKRFETFKASKKLAEFEELKKYATGGPYQKEKQDFRDKVKNTPKKERHSLVFSNTESFKKYNVYTQLKADEDIRFFVGFEKSKPYKNYLEVKDSADLKKYSELKGITESEAFVKQKAYLEDKNKWEKTEEYAQEQKYFALKKLPHFVKYLKYKGGKEFDFFKTWDLVFDDHFEKLDENKWSALNYWAEKLVGENFSQPGDLQCFNGAKNIGTGKNGLTIRVKNEKAKGKFWNPAAGFTPADFQYTSGQICTGDRFRIEGGIIEAKIKFNPVSETVSIFYLLGDKPSPQLTVFEMGTKNRLGMLVSKDGKTEFSGVSISNLSTGKYYIFSLEKTAGQLAWKINGVTLFEMSANDASMPMFLNFSSIVVGEVPPSKLPASFEVEWVRCYTKK